VCLSNGEFGVGLKSAALIIRESHYSMFLIIITGSTFSENRGPLGSPTKRKHRKTLPLWWAGGKFFCHSRENPMDSKLSYRGPKAWPTACGCAKTHKRKEFYGK